tara:strand:+ start:6484 stop:6819 length:336 start_codon:yes stop_codon:yes gene_type:complete
MDTIKKIAKTYFLNFSNKDISLLEKMFTDDVELRDWNFHGKGIQEVIEINKKIFANNDKILVSPLKIWQVEENLIIADLEIDIGNPKKELVLDILVFEREKIKKIIAYKGN